MDDRVNALDIGIPANAIAEAVFARAVGAQGRAGGRGARILRGPTRTFRGAQAHLVESVRGALYCSKICAYAQGFELMAEAQKE